MKIITNTKRGGKNCFVQVKDLLFLARYTNNKRLMQDYIDTINKGRSDDEFIKVSGESYIKAFELCDYIIDFTEYSKRDIGINYLSNMIKIKVYAIPKEKIDQEGLDLQIDAIRDVIAYKRGDLDYKIPLVSDGTFEITSNDKKLIFDSTVIEDCYSLHTLDGSDLENHNYQVFLNNCIDEVYGTLYPDVTEKDYSTFILGKTLVIRIKKSEVKEKKSVVGKILAKIKKED